MFFTSKLYSYSNELFEIELIIYIKMDLALNNLQRLICRKTQTNYWSGNFVFKSDVLCFQMCRIKAERMYENQETLIQLKKITITKEFVNKNKN